MTATQKKITSSLSPIEQFISKDIEKLNAALKSQIEEMPSLIKDISQHLIENGGKKVRPALLFLCGKLLGPLKNEHIQAALSLELIHNATLLHDDVIDNSSLRRGRKAAHTLWSKHHSILTGDFLLSKALESLTALKNWDALAIVQKAVGDVVEGQAEELNPSNLSLAAQEERYFKIIAQKTAALFEAAAALPCALDKTAQKHKEAFKRLGLHVGIAFQIVDDILDYVGDISQTGKPPGQDLQEKKITLPIILLYKKSTTEEKAFLTSVFSSGVQEEKAFEKVLSLLNKYETISSAKLYVEHHCQQVEKITKNLPGEDVKTHLLLFTETLKMRLNQL